MDWLTAELKRFFQEDAAPTLAEYGLLLVFTALAVAGTAFALGESLGGLFQSVAPAVGNHAPPPS